MANNKQSNSTAFIGGMQSILSFVLGVAAMAFHVWTCIQIYNIWGFKLGFPAFVLPIFAEVAMLVAEIQRTHDFMNNYAVMFYVLLLGFIIQNLIGRAGNKLRGR